MQNQFIENLHESTNQIPDYQVLYKQAFKVVI